MEQTTPPRTKSVAAREIGALELNMTASETPCSPAERKRARRHKVSRKLYEQLVVQEPRRLTTLRDRAGKVVAKHHPRPQQGDADIVSQ
jgi:hypothetical protein